MMGASSPSQPPPMVLLVMALVPAAVIAVEALLGAWLLGGIPHLTLGALGAASRPAASTMRVFGYGQACLVWLAALSLLGRFGCACISAGSLHARIVQSVHGMCTAMKSSRRR
jgi:hypothetical protein